MIDEVDLDLPCGVCSGATSWALLLAYVATSPRLTFKNFKLSDFLKFSDFNEVPTKSLMMIY